MLHLQALPAAQAAAAFPAATWRETRRLLHPTASAPAAAAASAPADLHPASQLSEDARPRALAPALAAASAPASAPAYAHPGGAGLAAESPRGQQRRNHVLWEEVASLPATSSATSFISHPEAVKPGRVAFPCRNVPSLVVLRSVD